MGKRPVASGSSVPPWPALAASNKRRTAPTADVEVIPKALSRTTQPSTRLPRRLHPIVLVPWVATLIRGVLGQVARDIGIVQQPLDALRLVEGKVGREMDRRCHAQLDLVGQAHAKKGRGAVQCLGQRLR